LGLQAEQSPNCRGPCSTAEDPRSFLGRRGSCLLCLTARSSEELGVQLPEFDRSVPIGMRAAADEKAVASFLRRNRTPTAVFPPVLLDAGRSLATGDDEILKSRAVAGMAGSPYVSPFSSWTATTFLRPSTWAGVKGSLLKLDPLARQSVLVIWMLATTESAAASVP